MNLPAIMSRTHLPSTSESKIANLEQVNALEVLSVTEEKYADIQQCTQIEHNQLQAVVLTCWPDTRQEVPASLRPWWDSRSELAVSDGVICKGRRIVVPPSPQRLMLSIIH